jgi:hypothetical protein
MHGFFYIGIATDTRIMFHFTRGLLYRLELHADTDLKMTCIKHDLQVRRAFNFAP